MTDRNIEKEIFYSWYEDKETGLDNENIHYPALIGLLGELIDRVETLETQLKDVQELVIAQDYMKNLGL